MSKRKVLPYHATALVDDAIMENTEAVKILETLVRTPTTTEERYRLIGLALSKVHRAIDKLKEIER